MVHLESTSVEWALDFISSSSDSDLFPPTPEFSSIQALRQQFVSAITVCEVKDLSLGASRRFLVPKDEVSYRQATQLDPQDALVLTALVHQFGDCIETRRLPESQVYSYRFEPSSSGLYRESSNWNHFWMTAARLAKKAKSVVYCDIADFYNQIYHHTLENQLIESGFPNQATKWILGLCESTTAGVSRGVPIGPHAVHLLAEGTLIPIDNALLSHGLKFIRYADDILVFVPQGDTAQHALSTVAQTLDRQQRLLLQRHKTRIYSPAEFEEVALHMIEDQPISEREADLLRIVRKYSGGNPYQTVWFGQIDDEDWRSITEETLGAIVNQYLSDEHVNYTRLGWFYRRLAQLGHPGALPITLQLLDRLTPCFPSVISYLASLQSIDPGVWRSVGGQLAALLDADLFRDQEYYQVLLLSLFARNQDMNHFAMLAKKYTSSTPAARRQILLAAAQNGAVDWLRELKEDFPSMDLGQRLAFLHGSAGFPADERKYFIQRHQATFVRPLESIVAKAART